MAPAADIGGERFNYRVDGPEGAPVVMLSNSLGANLAMWEAQVPELARRFRVLRYDSRGHGASPVTPGPYTIERLSCDVVALLDALRVARCHFCGLSMGGAIGMWLAVNAPERVDRLVLCNTSAKIFTPERWNARIDAVRTGGVASIADAVLEGWFTRPFRERQPETVARMRAMLAATPTEGYVACCAALRDTDQWAALARIKRPTLLIAGTHDAATPVADAQRMAQNIDDARCIELDAAHISNIEAAAEFTGAVVDFLTQ